MKHVQTKSVVRLAILLITLVIGFASGYSPVLANDSKGTDFWLAFTGNLGAPELTLFITGDTSTSGTVEIPGLAFSTPFAVTPGTVTSVSLPANAQMENSDVVEDLGIHITAAAEVTVYGLNRIQFTTDAFLGLPTDILGTDYIVAGYQNSNIVNATEFGLVGVQDGTTVTIIPSVTTGTRPVGVPYNITLNRGQTYQLRNTDAAPNDLSGTVITSDKPVAVFGGHQCANIPPGVTFCDYVVEQLPPTTTWGKSFVTLPLATRLNGDTFRFFASTDNTQITVNGAIVATLNRGQLHEQIITGSAQISADKPIMVMQYSNGTSFDGVTSDPFMMLIPPFEQFLARYTVTTPAIGFNTNFINIVAPNAAVGNITVDGVPVPTSSFDNIGSTGFSGAQVSVSLGAHNLAGPLPFGAFMYGFADFDSYGYPGGMSLAQVAIVTNLSLAPKTATNPVNTQHCVIATVTDQNNTPVSGVRVDFAVTGSNPTVGFAQTANNGDAQFCYTGANAGTDNIVASVGTLSDSATKTWTAVATPTTLTLTPETATNPVNTQHCVVALVKDQNGAPMSGINVVFTVTGVNPTSGSGTTNASGQAEFCYIGANAGGDTITATAGSLSDTATKTWQAPTGPEQINAFLQLTALTTSYRSKPVSGGPAGTATIKATFKNISTHTFTDLYFLVAQLTGGNVLYNADGGPGGVGAKRSVPNAQLGADNVLTPGESFRVTFVIGLATRNPFDFFVDAYGTVVGGARSAALEAENSSFQIQIGEDAFQNDLIHDLFLPIVTQ